MGNFILQICFFIVNLGLLAFGIWLKQFVSDKSTTITKKLDTELGNAGLYGIIACCVSIFLFIVTIGLLSRYGKLKMLGPGVRIILFSIFIVMILGLIIFSVIYDTKIRTRSDQDKYNILSDLSYVIVSITSGLVGVQIGMFLNSLTSVPSKIAGESEKLKENEKK